MILACGTHIGENPLYFPPSPFSEFFLSYILPVLLLKVKLYFTNGVELWIKRIILINFTDEEALPIAHVCAHDRRRELVAHSYETCASFSRVTGYLYNGDHKSQRS